MKLFLIDYRYIFFKENFRDAVGYSATTCSIKSNLIISYTRSERDACGDIVGWQFPIAQTCHDRGWRRL